MISFALAPNHYSVQKKSKIQKIFFFFFKKTLPPTNYYTPAVWYEGFLLYPKHIHPNDLKVLETF